MEAVRSGDLIREGTHRRRLRSDGGFLSYQNNSLFVTGQHLTG